MKTAIIEDRVISVGDKINFKLDNEQDGKIIKIEMKEGEIFLTVKGNFSGILAGTDTFDVELKRCWLSNNYKTVAEKNARKRSVKGVEKVCIENNKYVVVGDTVQFKCDTEQEGIVTEIVRKENQEPILTLKATSQDGFDGNYIGGEMFTTMEAKRCWK